VVDALYRQSRLEGGGDGAGRGVSSLIGVRFYRGDIRDKVPDEK